MYDVIVVAFGSDCSGCIRPLKHESDILVVVNPANVIDESGILVVESFALMLVKLNHLNPGEVVESGHNHSCHWCQGTCEKSTCGNSNCSSWTGQTDAIL